MNVLPMHSPTTQRGRPALLLALALLLVGLVIAAPAGIALAQDEPPFSEDVVTATTSANLRIRSMPGLDGDILTVLPSGTVVGFTGLTDQTGDWVQVDAVDGPVGWVWAAYLSNVPDNLTVWSAEGMAGDEEVAETEPSFGEDVVTATTTNNLRIRSAPGLDGEMLTILPFGTVVGFTGLTDETGDWVQVDAAGGPVGWVWGAYLSNVPDDLTMWSADDTAGGQEDTAGVVEPPFGEDVVTATTTANLRLRSAPGLDGELLTVLPFGTVVGFTGLTDETGQWVQVDAAGGPVGWVWAAFLSNVPDDLTAWSAS
ncbi:MAG: SH3 domain-containing protein [Candidatus Promineofilum sp.]|uniref:SH3 domain-containing protein n=1 Tax=Promineifilum sp. TaxID=2664178 RepID=UPI002411B598|nr:SH3 domain-containing protein [Promineifilum sp.]